MLTPCQQRQATNNLVCFFGTAPPKWRAEAASELGRLPARPPPRGIVTQIASRKPTRRAYQGASPRPRARRRPPVRSSGRRTGEAVDEVATNAGAQGGAQWLSAESRPRRRFKICLQELHTLIGRRGVRYMQLNAAVKNMWLIAAYWGGGGF
ncbi:hypothetical protein LX32DRAFT_228467 [Colletotrichum zoysiae]|uniref:Uncharacterized protein n=1 Tax=Colletotrichum zoysiae TaxID=1216348 RepID=A0AAD9M507_9PEZI|nr:hypothetical protein LX32DRAFT_228467 [Colletotrichum zoysiae]